MRAPSALESRLVRAAAALASGHGPTASLIVLTFHRVLGEPDPLLPDEPDAARFAAELDLLGACFQVLPLGEALGRLASGTLPLRAACLTFDDGYANNREVALPLLLARGLPATFFVATGFLDGGRMFNDTVIETVRRAPEEFDLRAEGLGEYRLVDPAARRRAVDDLIGRLKYLDPVERLARAERIATLAGVSLPADLMMTAAQVREVQRAGMEIGAHSVDHPILARVALEEARRQIVESKRQLEVLNGAPVRAFAYPNGRPGQDYGREHVAMVREAGFEFALSTAWGAASRGSDPHQVPRVAPWDRTPLRYGLRLARAYRSRAVALA